MTKLETMKDIEKKAMAIYQQHINIKTAIPEIFLNARQEAINDIKELKRIDNKYNTWSYSEEGRNAMINYIMWKFDIAEEDLK